MQTQWKQNYEKLAKFIVDNGRWPGNVSDNEDEVRLYKWCNQQKFKNKNRDDYPDEYVYLLNKIRIDWRISNPVDNKKWVDNYSAILEFISINNRFPHFNSEGHMYSWYKYYLRQTDYWGPADWRLALMQNLKKYEDAFKGKK